MIKIENNVTLFYLFNTLVEAKNLCAVGDCEAAYELLEDLLKETAEEVH